MEEFKISLFESEYKLKFPGYKTLSVLECEELVNSIAKRLQIKTSSFESQLVPLRKGYIEIDALEGFKFSNTLAKLQIKASSNIFLNWYQFKKIDLFKIDSLDRYFYDIWFPSSDDIDLFDESLSWILSIRHDGYISYIK
jgi:hypothetical protein